MRKQFLIIITLLLLFVSCKKSLVEFSESQPKDVKDISSFPKKIMGNYYNLDDDVDLEISKYLIVKKVIIRDTINIKELSKFESLRNDTIINSNTSEKYPVKRISDSLFTNYVYLDTIFNLTNGDILRKLKGYYFLNTKSGDNSWNVKKVYLKNGQLNINDISTDEEIVLLEEITETKKDTIKPFTIKPTKKQFKEFVKKNGFSKGEIYLKK